MWKASKLTCIGAAFVAIAITSAHYVFPPTQPFCLLPNNTACVVKPDKNIDFNAVTAHR